MISFRDLLEKVVLLPTSVGVVLIALNNSAWIESADASLEVYEIFITFLFFFLMSTFEYLILLARRGNKVLKSKTTIKIISVAFSLQMLILFPILGGWLFILGWILVKTPTIITDFSGAIDIISQVVAYAVTFLLISWVWRIFFFHYMAIAKQLSRWVLRTQDPRAVIKLIEYVYYLTAAVGICIYLVETNSGRSIDANTSATLIVVSMVVLSLRLTKVTIELRADQFLANQAGIRSLSGTPIWPVSALEGWMIGESEVKKN